VKVWGNWGGGKRRNKEEDEPSDQERYRSALKIKDGFMNIEVRNGQSLGTILEASRGGGVGGLRVRD